MKKKSLIFFAIFLVAISCFFVNAADFTHAVSNSENWEDVYSSLLYANLNGVDSDFLVSTSHGPILLDGISKSNDLLIISSSDKPYVLNYKSIAESKSFASVQEMSFNDVNLGLVDEMPGINNFIVVGNSYGYSAIAVVPYALTTNSWVFLADAGNIDDIDSILSQRNIDKLVVYGYVDTEVSQTLSKYNPEEINTGDRFADNIEIVRNTIELKPTTQVLLTNGEFIEKELMAGKNPILFTGRENVPDKIADYLINSNIEIGVLIGNELIGAATNIRRSTGINVMVKFARGSRTGGDGVSAVEGLDLFYLPVATLDLQIYSINYNKATSQIEVTYQSNSNVPSYFTGTITLNPNDENIKIGDINPIFIAPGDFKTVVYEDITISEENPQAEIFTLYGEVKSSLDRVLEETIDIDVIDVLDGCDIEIISLTYNKQEKSFIAKVKNLEPVDCWTSVELRDVSINGIEQNFGTESPVKLTSKQSKKVPIKQYVATEDLEENSFVDLYAYYGERRDSLVKVFQGRFELDVKNLTTLTYLIIILILLIMALAVWFLVLRKKDEDFL